MYGVEMHSEQTDRQTDRQTFFFIYIDNDLFINQMIFLLIEDQLAIERAQSFLLLSYVDGPVDRKKQDTIAQYHLMKL